VLPLAWGVAALVGRRIPEARRGPLLGLSIVSVLLHVGADAWNNYGVHPFWPVDSTWRYGDAVFIIEPLLWTALLPLAWSLGGKRARFALGAAAILLTAVMGVGLGWGTAAVWAGLTTSVLLLPARVDRGVLAAALAIPTVLAFNVASHLSEDVVRRRLAEVRPGEEVLDVSMTPRAASPWCWQGHVMALDADRYHARAFVLSLAPSWMEPKDCELRQGDGRTARLLDPDLASDPAIAWGPRFEAPAGELAELAAGHCRIDAFLRFGRAPYWQREGEGWVVGDLRYDMEAELGFAEIEVGPGDTRGCGPTLPPWRSEVARRLLAP
jgi:inner membrane protein